MQRFRTRQYTVRVVMAVMRSVAPPLGFERGTLFQTGAGLFAGYLLLDALVGNQDRHHENWGLLISPGQSVTVAPTFDHASSLGRNESDERREARLNTMDKGYSVEAYAARAKSAFYATRSAERPLSTIEAYVEGAKSAPKAAMYWLERLADISDGAYWSILENIPDQFISNPAREFALRMLQHNARRLLESEAAP